MASKTYRSAKQFAREFRRDIMRMAEGLTAAYHWANHDAALKMLKAFPIESLRGAYVNLVEGRRASVDSIRHRPVRPDGIVSTIGNTHKAFHAINFGRKRVHYKGFTRLGGTTKAPRGMTKPTAEKLLSTALQNRLRLKAIRHAERTLR